jgi:hypothetical protein
MPGRYVGEEPWPPAGKPPHASARPRVDRPTSEQSEPAPTGFAGPESAPGSLFIPPPTRGLAESGQHATPAGAPAGAFAHPEPPSTSKPSGSTRKIRILIAASVAVLVLAGLATLVTGVTRGPNSAPADSSRAPGGPQPPAAPPSTGPPDGQGEVPDGFYRYRDRGGFSFLIPKGWGKPQRKRTGVFFYAPDDRRRYIQIAYSDRPAADAYSAWRKLEKAKRQTLRDYRRVQLKKIDYPGATTAADWEFTWTGVTARMHILDRTFVINGRGYAILISAPDKKWAKTFKRLQPVLNSYQPA